MLVQVMADFVELRSSLDQIGNFAIAALVHWGTPWGS
jgi:hypothetical protein